MKILLLHKFHQPKGGGAERIYFETARLLEAAGHEVAFFSTRDPKNAETPWSRFFIEPIDFSDGQGISAKLRSARKLLWNDEAVHNLEALLAEFKPDVAHCFNIYHQLTPAVLHTLKKHAVPIVFTLCDFKVISPSYFLYHFGKHEIWESTSGWRAIFDKLVQNSYTKSALCAIELWLHRFLKSPFLVSQYLAPSQFLAKKYQELGFAPGISQVHHPVGVWPKMQAQKRPKELLFIGRLSPEKGVDVAIRALAELPEWRLKIVGAGEAEGDLQRLAEELGLSERVEFLGPIYGPELKPRMAEAQAIVFPSVWYENQPFALTDALISGTPVIASNLGSIPEVIEHGKSGFLFEAGNPKALAQCVRELGTHDLQKIGREAQKLEQAYSDEGYTEELLTYYEQVLAHRS